MLRVHRSEDPDRVIVSVSGRLGADNVYLLLEVLDSEPCDTPLVLALGELRLVDPFGVGFLARCEAEGIRLHDCPPFIRLWIEALQKQESESERCSMHQA